MDLFHRILPLPRANESKLALAFAKLSKDDLAASRVLYSNELFPQAVYSLQQSVEKSAKALGLTLGTIKTNQIRTVNHRSVLALLTRTGTLSRNVKRGVDAIRSIHEQGGDVGKILNLGSLVEKMIPLVPTEAALTRDRENIRRLDARTMWLATLNLDRNNRVVADALSRLKEIAWDKPDARASIGFLKQLYALIGGDDPLVEYAFSSTRALPRAVELSLLTMWHEEPTRYPPASRLDYWDPDAYTSEKELVKQLPMLTRHAKLFCDGIYKRSVAATKLSPN